MTSCSSGSGVSSRVVSSTRGGAPGLTWQLDVFERGCRRLTFTPPLQPLAGYEPMVHQMLCSKSPSLTDEKSDSPLELLAVGRQGTRQVVAIDADPSIKAIVLDGKRRLRPSSGSVFVDVGAAVPKTVEFHETNSSGHCRRERYASTELWWLNCTYQSNTPITP